MTDHTELIERLKKFRGMWMGDGIHPSIERQALIDTLQRQAEEIEALRAEVHNLNWALGTPGFDRMATEEEQAEHEAGMARVNEVLARLQANKDRHAEMVENDARYRWLRRDVTSLADIREMTNIIANLCEAHMDAAIDTAMQGVKG